MADVFPLDINDQIDEEDLSDDEFEEVSLFWMRGGDEIAYNENLFRRQLWNATIEY